jgi:hypothetical protein
MPNWCSNQLILCGPVTWVDLFKEKISNEDGSYNILENLYPIPDSLDLPSRFGAISDDDPNKEQKESNLVEHGSVDWYDWCTTNWGTKWSDCETELYDEYVSDEEEDTLKIAYYRFESAWGPPQEGIQHICKSFKPILFDLRYQEPGMMFCGCARFGNGELISEQTAELVMDADNVYQNIDWDYEYDMKRGLDEADVS